MQQNLDLGRELRHKRAHATLIRVLAAAALAVLVLAATSPARAGDDDSAAQASVWSKFMRSIGLQKAPEAAGMEAGINYTERPPLVVPASRDLPPPIADRGLPADWPKDSAKALKHAKAKPGVVAGTAVQTPNPPVQKKPWYNPAGWFDHEEYATFAGEPARADLTDPPDGYRMPSPAQPYGIGPDKKADKASMANPRGMAPVTPQ